MGGLGPGLGAGLRLLVSGRDGRDGGDLGESPEMWVIRYSIL